MLRTWVGIWVLLPVEKRENRINENKQLLQYDGNNVKFYINGKELECVTNLKYLGYIFSENDCNSLCIQS